MEFLVKHLPRFEEAVPSRESREGYIYLVEERTITTGNQLVVEEEPGNEFYLL